jgi:pimeloyl-ACP methyl ester carboxylesterase
VRWSEPAGANPMQGLSGDDVIRAQPIWFGEEERPAFGWLHLPPGGKSRGGVLVCPPIGRDYLQGHYALRLLAESLADAGFSVLRFDYDGTGNSAGDNLDPNRVESWLGTVRHAVQLLREMGIVDLSAVGMRIGSLLATTVSASGTPFDQLVLWDPCVSGRAFLREESALFSLLTADIEVTPHLDDGSLETSGMVYAAATVSELRTLDVVKLPRPFARRVLTLVRSDRFEAPIFSEESVAGEVAERGEATGQTELMDRGSPHQEPPVLAVKKIVTWLTAGARGRPQPVRAPSAHATAVVGTSPLGLSVRETFVEVPPAGLFGVVSEPSVSVADSPTVIFLSVANQPGVGPNRLWVELSRQWAYQGVRSFRLDLSGLGDSPSRNMGHERWFPLKPEAFDDVSEAAQCVAPEDPSNVILVGLCSSGYQALDSAFGLRPRGAVAINPSITFVPPEKREGKPLDPRRRIVFAKDSVPDAFREGGRLSSLRNRFPQLAWWVRSLAAPNRRSGAWLPDLDRQGTHVLAICGELERRPIRYGITAHKLRRLSRRGSVNLQIFPDLHHELLIAKQRQKVADLVSDFVLTRSRAADAGHEHTGNPCLTCLAAAAEEE